jgi:hypothetical protein
MEKKDSLRSKFYTIILVSIVLVGGFVSIGFTAFIDDVVIGFSGRISDGGVTAQSGYAQDIQAAVDLVAATGGGTVHVPAGTFNWNNEQVTIPSEVTVIGASPAGCRGAAYNWEIVDAQTTIITRGNTPFRLNSHSRLSGLKIRGPATSSNEAGDGVMILPNALDWRVDHCILENWGANYVAVSDWTTNTPRRGLVDHCFMNAAYKDAGGGIWGYGVGIESNEYTYFDGDITHYLGKYETVSTHNPTVYIEDCRFYKTRHAVAGNQQAWYCFRYNYVYQPDWNSGVDIHGGGSGVNGGRGGEVYGNYVDSIDGINWRGGGGVIYDNLCGSTTHPGHAGVVFQNEPDAHPQSSQSSLWVWGNKELDGVTAAGFDGDGLVQNTNYFLRPPNQAQDGFTYTPYPYPHPLAEET